MGDRGWKQFERRCARDMGVERIPVTGERAGADARTPLFAFQFKCRRVIPGWLFSWLAGIVQAAGRDQVGVLVLKRPRMQDRDAVVLLRWSDWVDLHGKKENAIDDVARINKKYDREFPIGTRIENPYLGRAATILEPAAAAGAPRDGASPKRAARSSVRGDRGLTGKNE